MKTKSIESTRRQFLGQSASCGAWVATLAALSPRAARRVFALTQDEVVATEKWGRIEKVADNMWALISTLDEQDYTTVCNGGIIAGTDRVLAVETFMKPEGARWLAEWAEKLTGRWPDEVVVTHYHADHSAGMSGYLEGDRSPRIWLSDETRQQIQASRPDTEIPDIISALDAQEVTRVDLGSRQVALQPRSGHTNSDIVVEVADPNVVWTGDLFFNRMVPNYRDSRPGVLNEVVDEMAREGETIYVPGHGPVADAEALALYREFLGMVQQAATEARQAGSPAEAAATEFTLPEKFSDWFIFAPEVMPNAFAAWYRQLESDAGESRDR
ncbi:MAG: MBL fold metallo-hydrolase [Pirellulaceae bacterium]